MPAPEQDWAPGPGQVSYRFEYVVSQPQPESRFRRVDPDIEAQSEFYQQLQAGFNQQFAQQNTALQSLIVSLVNGAQVTVPRPPNSVQCEAHGILHEAGTPCYVCERDKVTTRCCKTCGWESIYPDEPCACGPKARTCHLPDPDAWFFEPRLA